MRNEARHGMVENTRRFPTDSANLDLLRAVAVLAVFVCHFWGLRTGRASKWDFMWHLGHLGVLLFFVHTCLVLMWSIGRMRIGGGQLFAVFYVRRFFRIYPLSVFCVLVVSCLSHRWGGLNPICHPGSLTPKRLFFNLTLVSNLYGKWPSDTTAMLTPLWSLPLELQMYLVLPILFIFLRRRAVRWVFVVWLLSVLLALVQPILGTACLVFLFAPCFLGGVVAWRLAEDHFRPRLPGWMWPLAIGATSTIWMLAPPQHAQYYRALFGLCLGLSIPLFREIPWNPIKDTARIVAKYSYGIYLSHFPILLLVFRRLPHHGRITHYFIMALLMLVLPLILYHGIEAPGIHYGKALAGWICRKRIGRDATSMVTPDESSFRPAAS